MRAIILIAVLMANSRTQGWVRPDARDSRSKIITTTATPSGGGCDAPTGSAIVSGDWIAAGTVDADPPTITANYGTSPDCTDDSYRAQFNPTVTTNYSIIINTSTCPLSTSNLSLGVWAKAASNKTIDVCTDSNHSARQCGTWSVTTDWAFYKFENKSSWTTENDVFIGNNSANNGGVSRSAADVQFWGFRCVTGATISQ